MKRALFVLVLLFAAPALAAHYPTHKLHTMASQPGQSKVAFLLDVAHWMRAYSDKTGFEACAAIGSDGVGYGVVITTSRAHVACYVDYTALIGGMRYTNETIHSHPHPGYYRPNRSDRYLSPHRIPRGYSIHETFQSANHFSVNDIKNGTGYLVGTIGLFYQYGLHTQTRIAPMTPRIASN